MNKVKNNNIFLIGPMGAGKSSVGRHLAKHLAKEFFDTDEEVEKRTGVNLGWIFDVEGEDGFRKREAAVVADLTSRGNIVLATGGGTICTSENRNFLAGRGTIVYLEVSLSYQQSRVTNDARRPLLQVKNRDEVLVMLHHERKPLYEEIADFRVLTDNRNVRAVVEDILDWLEANGL